MRLWQLWSVLVAAILLVAACGPREEIVYVDPEESSGHGYRPFAKSTSPRVHLDGEHEEAADVELGGDAANHAAPYVPIGSSHGQLVHVPPEPHVVSPIVLAYERQNLPDGGASIAAYAPPTPTATLVPSGIARTIPNPLTSGASVVPATGPANPLAAGPANVSAAGPQMAPAAGPSNAPAAKPSSASAPPLQPAAGSAAVAKPAGAPESAAVAKPAGAPEPAAVAKPASAPEPTPVAARAPLIANAPKLTDPGDELDTIIGKVETIVGSTLTLDTVSGKVKVQMNGSPRVERDTRGSPADLRPGQYVGVLQTPNGPAQLIRLYATGPSMPRPGWVPVAGSRTGEIMTFGSIVTLQFGGLLLNAGSQTTTVGIPNEVEVLKPAPAGLADVSVGSQVIATGPVSGDGTLNALAVRLVAPTRQ